MDSWTLQGDSYSFLRSAPRNFSLCHRDGTPNHVEIFDIINAPTQRSAISETTCLCDIFGDDCESQSLSSSPAVVAFVPTQRELDGTAAVSPSVDDQNDSSGSYHTAPGSSEGEEGSEDSRERFYSPPLQSEYSEKRLSEDKVAATGYPEVPEDSGPNIKTKHKSPVPQQNKSSPSSPIFSTDQRTPTPGHTSSDTTSPEGRLSSLSSSSFEKRHSPLSPDPKQINSETEPSTIVSSEDRHSSASYQFLTTSPTPEPGNCVNSSSSESANTQFFPDSLSQNSSPLPEQTFQDLTESTFESRTFSSPSPLPSQSKLSNARETPVSPGLSDTLSFPDTQASSPFPELRGRVSLPDLLSRGSTPDIGNLTHNTELISVAERDFPPSPEGQNKKLSLEPGSNVSTPAPRHTPPSPVISVTTSPECVEIAASPELRNTDHSTPLSPSLLRAASPTITRISTPSREPSPNLTFSVGRTQLSSPVVSYSLSPSPGIRDSCSPTEYRYPSPEIRITASSPEFSREKQSPSLPEPHTDLAISGTLTSSPHISGVSYSVVQPEDRHSPPFPELSHLSSPELDRTLMSTDTQGDSTHTPGLVKSISQSDISKLGVQTPSPQLNYHTPSPDSRTQTLSPDKYQSPSPQNKSRDLSPVSPLSGHNYQHSPASLSRGYSPHYTQSVNSLRSTPEVERDCCEIDITDEQSHTFPVKDNVSPSFGSGNRNNLAATEIKHSSPTVVFQSPVSNSPVSSEKSRNPSPKHRGTDRKERQADINIQNQSSIVFVSEEENNDLVSHFFQTESSYNPSIDLPPTDLILSKNRSPVHQALSSSVQTVETPHSQLNSYALTSENRSTLKPAHPPGNSSRQLSTKVKRENRDRSTEDMSRRVNRRRTPSPPLTRFTPVHIIAPEKPYRHWQNRRHSPPQTVASSPNGNLKKAVTNRESPDVAPVDNNSQAPWVGPGWQLEREMQLEQEREIGRERQRDRELKKERKREEQVPEKGEGWQGEASYRGEQVELSFNARNRKGPVNRTAAPTSRETRQGLPAVHSYSEGLLATRQLQQQQNLLRLASQQDTRVAGASRRQLPAPQNKNSAPRRVSTNRPSRSSSSSMGSELDEADNEVKWFTDLAFSSLSSPEVDYLDMYSSSHRSSTNISQPSTQESPAGINATWPAYADFRGSAPRLDQDELTIQQPSAYYSEGLDPSRRYELGSYECVDVAVEREDSRKIRRGVPKRQIQLKRRAAAEGNLDESSENSSPGLPVMVESPSQESHFRGGFVRQNSTPAAIQECYPSECSPDPPQQNDKKSKLKKSSSVDETCSKTKMATCLIKSVLSKKMQGVDDQLDDQVVEDVSPTFEESNPPTETAIAPLKVSPKPYTYNLNSSHQTDHSLSSECLLLRGEPSTKDDAKPPKGFGVRSSNRPSSSNSSRSVNFSLTDSEEADSQSTNANLLRTEMVSELKVPFDIKHSGTGAEQPSDSKTCVKDGGDSANANAGNTGAPSATGASSMQVRETNRNQECENMEDHKQPQPSDKDACVSKPQEITVKAVEKKKASLNVCLTPEAEIKPEMSFPNVSFREKEEVVETRVDGKTEKEGNENTNVKAPIHKVRDVRRLVKNTYNLSFKAATTATPSNVNEEKIGICEAEMGEDSMIEKVRVERQGVGGEERREEKGFWMDTKEEQREEVKNIATVAPSLQGKGKSLSGPQPIQIECKAVRWTEDKNKTSCIYKDSENAGDKLQASSNSLTEVSRKSQSLNSQDYKTEDTTVVKLCEHNVSITEETQETTTAVHKVASSEDKPVVVRTDRKPPMLGSLPKLPSKEREVSTAVVLIREGSSKTKTSASPAQEDIPNLIQAPAASPSLESVTPGGHSVSMLLKEKGFQADIGAVVGENQNTSGDKKVPHKHVNCLEIPLQTNAISDEICSDSDREKAFSSTSTACGPSARTDSTDMLVKATDSKAGNIKSTERDMEKQKRNPQDQALSLTRQKELGDFESVKRMDPSFPPRSPAIRRFKPQPIEVKSLSKEPQTKENPPNMAGNSRPQTIEVKSIAKNSQKPAVPPKPSCKFKPSDMGAMPNDAQRPPTTASAVKLQGEERTQTIVVSSPTIYRKISNDSSSTSNYSRKLAVSAVSSLKPPPSKPAPAVIPDQANQSTATSGIEVSNDRRQSAPSSQSSSYAQTRQTLTTAPTSTEGSSVNSEPGLVSDSNSNQISGSASTVASHESQPAVMDPDNQLRYSRPAYPHEQAMPPSKSTKQATAVSTTQVPRYSHQSCRRSLSSERSQRTDDLRFYASDDPPSYDERESFSPLMLPDLTPLRSNRYQLSSRPPPCSCTAGCPSHPGLTPPHHHRSPHNLTPPAPPHSPGQPLPYPVVQPGLRPHQCRPEPQPLSYQPGSPKSSPIGPNQPPTVYQPLPHSAPCPTHPSLIQTCPVDRPIQPPQHMDPRRPPVHRSPHQQPPGITGAPYSDTGHSHSPGLPPMDPQYLCGPQSMGPSYGSEYGGDSSSLYSESSFAQAPRRVLMDPETGKYFYIEVPVQPLRKMLFDPETGQYVEVLIPQQAVSHSAMYPPSAAPYPPLPNPNMYAHAPQYMPYAAPPPPAHPQAQPQPPRYPEASATAAMHPSGSGVSYRNPSTQASKPDSQTHPPLDHGYLESMYYVPTGMNASPNPTPPDYYHKHPPNLPPTGGKRS